MTFYLRSLQCAGSIGRYPHVCCIAPNIIPQQQQQPQQQRPQQRPQRPQGRQATRLRPLGRSSGTGHLIPGFGTCGLTSLAQRIFGGEETQLDEYPWMAIFEYRRRMYKYFKSTICFLSCLVFTFIFVFLLAKYAK